MALRPLCPATTCSYANDPLGSAERQLQRQLQLQLQLRTHDASFDWAAGVGCWEAVATIVRKPFCNLFRATVKRSFYLVPQQLGLPGVYIQGKGG